MTDPSDSRPDETDAGAFEGPAFDDPAFDDVRALLASVRETGPVPAEVAARLDATLADLQQERRQTVVPLRRRVAPRLLVAAAVLAVLSVGSVAVGQLVGDGGGNDAAVTADDPAGGASALESAPERDEPPAAAQDSAGVTASSVLPTLSTASFAQDAARVMRTVAEPGSAAGTVEPEAAPSETADGLGEGPAEGGATGDPGADESAAAPPVTATPPALRRSATDCPGPDAAGAVTLLAELDGSPVALVFRPATAAGQLVEAWSCDGDRRLASAAVAR